MAFVLLLIGAGLIGACARIAWGALAEAKALDKAIAALREVPLAELEEPGNMVAVQGVAKSVGRDPLLDKTVAYTDIVVSAPFAYKEKGSASDITHRLTMGNPMVISDSSGEVIVHMESIDWRLADQITEGSLHTPMEERYLEGLAIAKLAEVSTLHLEHRWVDDNQKIHIVGYARKTDHGFEFRSDENWQTIVTTEDVKTIKAAHRSSARALQISTLIFALFGVANVLGAIWLLTKT